MWEAMVALLDERPCFQLVERSVSPRGGEGAGHKTSLSVMMLSAATPGCMHDGIIPLTAHTDDGRRKRVLRAEWVINI